MWTPSCPRLWETGSGRACWRWRYKLKGLVHKNMIIGGGDSLFHLPRCFCLQNFHYQFKGVCRIQILLNKELFSISILCSLLKTRIVSEKSRAHGLVYFETLLTSFVEKLLITTGAGRPGHPVGSSVLSLTLARTPALMSASHISATRAWTVFSCRKNRHYRMCYERVLKKRTEIHESYKEDMN
jgi:hypothetical protein